MFEQEQSEDKESHDIVINENTIYEVDLECIRCLQQNHDEEENDS